MPSPPSLFCVMQGGNLVPGSIYHDYESARARAEREKGACKIEEHRMEACGYIDVVKKGSLVRVHAMHRNGSTDGRSS